MTLLRSPLMALQVLLSVGCAAGDATPDVAVRDSAGVTIVESARPAWSDGAGWRVAAEPSVNIGVVEGEEPYEFSRVAHARRLEDGRIVVANAGTGELRFFGPDGVFMHAAGRQGEGPGEFSRFASMRLCLAPDGAILAHDGGPGLNRLHRFSAAGEWLGLTRLEMPGRSNLSLMGCFADGSFLVLTPEGDGRLGGDPGSLIEMGYTYHRFGPDGQHVVTLAEGRAATRYVNQVGQSIHYPFVPFVAATEVASGTDALYVAPDGTAEVVRYTLDGAPEWRARWSPADRERVSDIWDAWTDEMLASLSEERRVQYARLYAADLPVPEFVPTVGSLLADDQGHVWIERYRLPWVDARRWDVLASDGRWLGTVTMPDGLRVLQIGADFVLGYHLDDLGVQRVRVHALERGN